MPTKQECESELYKTLEKLEQSQFQYDRDERQIERLEEDALWQNRNSRELINDLFDGYPEDRKLQRILMEKEELLQRKISLEKDIFQELRENISEKRKQADEHMEDYREQLKKLREDTTDENNDYDYPAAT